MGGSFWVLRRQTALRDRFFLRKTREVLRKRPDRWLDPADSRNCFVEIVPRENWRKLKAETATDFGLLLADAARAELVFEGDHRRVRIPLAALTRCAVEPITDMYGHAQHHAVVVEAWDGTRRLELPFIPYFPPWTRGKRATRQRARQLLARVRACLGERADGLG